MQQEIIARISAGIPNAEISVAVDGNRATIEVTSGHFEGMGRVQKQQAVYACIKDFIADGRLHAVTIKAQSSAGD